MPNSTVSETLLLCPICKLAAPDVELLGGEDFGRFQSYRCARCGQYRITLRAVGMASALTGKYRYISVDLS